MVVSPRSSSEIAFKNFAGWHLSQNLQQKLVISHLTHTQKSAAPFLAEKNAPPLSSARKHRFAEFCENTRTLGKRSFEVVFVFCVLNLVKTRALRFSERKGGPYSVKEREGPLFSK